MKVRSPPPVFSVLSVHDPPVPELPSVRVGGASYPVHDDRVEPGRKNDRATERSEAISSQERLARPAERGRRPRDESRTGARTHA